MAAPMPLLAPVMMNTLDDMACISCSNMGNVSVWRNGGVGQDGFVNRSQGGGVD